MKLVAVSLLCVMVSASALAQECTADWDAYFSTDPNKPKVISGDSNAGYALYSFWGDPNIELELRGNFPRARFMSFETEETRFPINFDALFDADLDPDEGSENPFRAGVALDTPSRAFTLRASPERAPSDRNTIKIPGGRLINALLLRIYRPNVGVTLSRADLPRIFAFDRRTGAAVRCPRPAPRPVRWHFPQFLADAYVALNDFTFKEPRDVGFLGLNQAAKYVYAVSAMDRGDVMTFRFRAPSIVDTTSGTGLFDASAADVRYWSFCTNNFPNNEGLACAADLQAPPHEDGYTYLAVGTGAAAKAEAQRRGYTFIPDIRSPRQRVMGFVYRNLVASDEFEAKAMYKGEYLPQGQRCSGREFLRGGCGF